ncbi:hypothetical protein PIB30_029150 [Stylosanthes scabra]|uniref:VQ domain-containing protein n=1 Tax=Stylosanthes scabra TaxID=79078 RepID=A0ABU6XA14_9FABA|nr:hypothetical protein [Stylosanthes scabra]
MRSDAKFFYGFQQEEEKTMTTKKAVMNGPRPSPLMINKDSHMIRKPSSSSSDQNKIRKPIIIYTQSPKIIHTKAQDFMALVQRLTGKSPTSNSKQKQHKNNNSNNEASDNFGSSLSDGSNNSSSIKQQIHHQWKKSEVDETSSALRRDDDDDYGGDDDDKKRGASIHHQYSPNSSLLNFADMPLFTPNSSSDIFCSSSSTRSLLFKHSDSSPYGILGNLISPSGLEFINELPEY